MSIINLLNGISPDTGEGIADAYDLDGTNDYWSRGTDLVGNADGKEFTISFFGYRDTAGTNFIYTNTSNRFSLYATSNGAMELLAANSSGTTILEAIIGSASIPVFPINTFIAGQISIDLTSTSNRFVYVNDVDFTSNVTWNTYTNDSIDFTQPDHKIGANPSNSQKWDGRLGGHFFFDYTYRDLSVEATRRLFINEDLTPAPIGGLSALSPIILFDFSEDAPNNIGGGGTFTQNGTIARSQRGPSQVNPVSSVYDGSVDYLSLAGPLTGASNAKTVTWSAKISLDTLSGTRVIYDMDNGNFLVSVVSGVLTFTGKNTSGTNILSLTAGTLVSNRQYLIVAAFDMANASNRDVQLNGVSQSLTVTTYTDDTLDLTGTGEIAWAALGGGTGKLDGTIGDCWFDNSYVSDLTKFYDSNTGKSKALGRMGEEITGSAPVGYWPMYGNDAGSDWSGNGNNFTVNNGPFVGARGFNEVWADSAEFDGNTGYLSRPSMVGINDSKTLSLAIAFQSDTGTVADFERLISFGGSDFTIFKPSSSAVIRVYANNTSGTNVLSLDTSSLSTTGWYTILLSFDLSDTNKRNMYVNGYSDLSVNVYTNDVIDFTQVAYAVGSDSSGTNHFDGKIGFLWFSQEYIDFSDEENRLKFFDAFNYPVDVGANGELPTGTAPILYMNNDFHLGTDSSGNGNDFSVNGTVTDGGQVLG